MAHEYIQGSMALALVFEFFGLVLVHFDRHHTCLYLFIFSSSLSFVSSSSSSHASSSSSRALAGVPWFFLFQKWRRQVNHNTLLRYHILDDLPSWIRTSEFIEQFEADFPGEPIELSPERLFPFPPEVHEGNVELVLENVRFFGVKDSAVIRKVFNFLIQETVGDGVSIWGFVHVLSFEIQELKVLWNNVLLLVKRCIP
jgi:hypothetical protein